MTAHGRRCPRCDYYLVDDDPCLMCGGCCVCGHPEMEHERCRGRCNAGDGHLRASDCDCELYEEIVG